MTYPQYKAVAQLDDDGFFIGMTMADLSPLEAESGVYLMPKNTIDTTPPTSKTGLIAKWQDDDWVYVEDLRGQIAYHTTDGSAVVIDFIGALPKQLTLNAPPAGSVWQEGRWVFDAAKLSLYQDQVWQAIKDRRHSITRGGVYVPSVGKWFHTDDSSRTQYLALQILPQLPPDLMWKTMDNSFVKLTKPLLTELAMTILTAEQADFANAEKHRLAMLQADNPFDYDFSSGWSDIYDQQ